MTGSDVLVTVWHVLKEYIPNREKMAAAEQLILCFKSEGVGESWLNKLAQSDDDIGDLLSEINEEDEQYNEDDDENLEY